MSHPCGGLDGLTELRLPLQFHLKIQIAAIASVRKMLATLLVKLPYVCRSLPVVAHLETLSPFGFFLDSFDVFRVLRGRVFSSGIPYCLGRPGLPCDTLLPRYAPLRAEFSLLLAVKTMCPFSLPAVSPYKHCWQRIRTHNPSAFCNASNVSMALCC